jgi:hypothetical protein
MRAILPSRWLLMMLARDSEFTAASVRRSDYERCREICGVASYYTSRLRTQLIKASQMSLTRLTRDSLLDVVVQIDDERRGR